MVHQISRPVGFRLTAIIARFEPFLIDFCCKSDCDRVSALDSLQTGLCFAGILIKSDDDLISRIRHIISLAVFKAGDFKRTVLIGVINEPVMQVNMRQRIRCDGLCKPVFGH